MEENFKNPSPKITNDRNFGLTKGDLRVYNEDLTMKEWDEYPKITVSMGENLEAYQNGIMRIAIQIIPEIPAKEFLIQVDGLMSIVYSVYAKTLNDLRRPTMRQKTIRIWGFFRKLFEKLKK